MRKIIITRGSFGHKILTHLAEKKKEIEKRLAKKVLLLNRRYMTHEQAMTYKDQNEIVSPADWDENTQCWVYDAIDVKTKISGEAFGNRISREKMELLHKMFPDRNDTLSNEPKYSHRQVNQMIRAAIAHNYKKN